MLNIKKITSFEKDGSVNKYYAMAFIYKARQRPATQSREILKPRDMSLQPLWKVSGALAT